MKLLTKEIEKKLLANNGKKFNGKFVCKFLEAQAVLGWFGVQKR